MALYKETSVNVGDIKAGQQNVKVEWFFDQLKKEDLAVTPEGKYAIQPSCGCTANFDVLDDRIVAHYNDGGNNVGLVSKAVTVYYNDAHVDVMVKNTKGVETYNPALGKTVLMFSANVIK